MTMTSELALSAPRQTGVFDSVRSFFAMMGSAYAVAAAVEARRAPRAADLSVLGIDGAAFRSIRSA